MNIKSQQIEMLVLKGLNFYESAKFADAELIFNQLVELDGQHETAYFYLARCCDQLNKVDEAIDFYTQGSIINPEYAKTNLAEVNYFLGLSLVRLEKYDLALDAFLKAGELEFGGSRLNCLIGDAYLHTHQFCKAIACYEELLSTYKNSNSIRINLGCALRSCGQYEQAIAHFNKVLESDPYDDKVYNNIGLVLVEQNQFVESIVYFDKAFSINPHQEGTTQNKGFSLLSLGDFENGWQCYEYRPTANRDQALDFKHHWRDSHVKKILIEAEQAFGDMIQMLRYIPLFASNNLNCYLTMPTELKTLVQRSFPWVDVISDDEKPIDIDLTIKVCSLPFVMNTYSEAEIPKCIPYLVVDEKKYTMWSEQFLVHNKPLIGIVWRGRNMPGKPDRSIVIKELHDLLSLTQFQFIVLQKDMVNPEREELNKHNNVTILDEALCDFDDTAAVMKSLDMMISIDSAPLHLAGALGVKAIALLPFSADWRWMVDRQDSPWYPNTILIRQKAPNDWNGVVNQVITLIQRKENV